MPFHALGRRALVVLAALGAALVAATPAVAAFLPPAISGPTHTTNPQPSFAVDGVGNPFDWCFVSGNVPTSGPQPAAVCATPEGTTSPASPVVPLSEGTYTLIAETGPDATDPGTPYTANSQTFVVDTTAPTLTLPPNTTLEATGPNGRTVNYFPTASDSGDGGAVPVSCTPAAVTPHTFAVGSVTTVSCSATDSAGNTSSGSFTVSIVDTTPPTVPAPSAPAPNAFITTATPTLSWAASTDVVGVTNYVVLIDGAPVATVPAPTTSFTTPALTSGAHTWAVRAVDAATNASVSSAAQSFTIGVPPATARR